MPGICKHSIYTHLICEDPVNVLLEIRNNKPLPGHHGKTITLPRHISHRNDFKIFQNLSLYSFLEVIAVDDNWLSLVLLVVMSSVECD